MKKIITITFASLFFAAAINAQQTAPVAAKKAVVTQQAPVVKPATTTYADKQKRADERAKATASITAYKATEHKPYQVKTNTAKPATETPAPVAHSAAYTKRADERTGRANVQPFANKKKK